MDINHSKHSILYSSIIIVKLVLYIWHLLVALNSALTATPFYVT